ncbi:MAG TPA: hypothetical protein VMO20_04715 [Candidatus Acidoferrum sp.]|nr:hypothetical protein [Candidatus Acidoferrum sp.]
MRPAFSSIRQAGAFALLLLCLLLGPAFAGKKILPSREAIYSSIWWENGDFPYMEEQVFREGGDMDIVFMGSSHIWAAFDTPYVQARLSKELGHAAVARTFGWGGAGYDETYFVAQDLLGHHRVRMLVIDDDGGDSDQPHLLASRMFRFGDNEADLDGLPASTKANYYFASIAGLPRNLLSLARVDLPADMTATNYWQTRSLAENFAQQFGAFTARIGFRDNPAAEPEPFVKYVPQTDVQPSVVCVYSSGSKTNFAFSSEPLPTTQWYFARKLAALAQEHGCKLVVLHVPTWDERHANVVSLRTFWPDVAHAAVTMIGVQPAKLFAGLTDDQMRKLYSDSVHFNENGQNYFTALMTPTLLKLYESQNH